MKPENDLAVNDASFIFIDTMFWFDVQKDKELRESFNSWLAKEGYEPIIHANLLLELFHTSLKIHSLLLYGLILLRS